MAVEARRGCGFRKIGGLYLVSSGLSEPCGKLPIELHVCPTCHAGIKQTRAWTWVKPRVLLADTYCQKQVLDELIAAGTGGEIDFRKLGADPCRHCPLAADNLPETAGLIWIGEQFYPTAEHFMQEAKKLGVSRRISKVPRNFKLGETWVLVAHPKAVLRMPKTPEEEQEAIEQTDITGRICNYLTRKGIITMFKPRAVEKIITESQSKDAAEMEKLAAKGITPVIVPDDDRDHQGSVHDRDEEDVQPQLPLVPQRDEGVAPSAT